MTPDSDSVAHIRAQLKALRAEVDAHCIETGRKVRAVEAEGRDFCVLMKAKIREVQRELEDMLPESQRTSMVPTHDELTAAMRAAQEQKKRGPRE